MFTFFVCHIEISQTIVPLVRLLVGQQSMSDGCTNLVSLGNQFTLGQMAQAIANKSRPKGKLGVECGLRCDSRVT